MKKYCIWFVIILVFLPVFRVHAAITINEVMYDLKDISDTDHEWVELYNSGTDTVSLSGWKFNDGANHSLNMPPQNGGQGALSIDAGDYIILSGNAATFLADHPGFSGTVIDTVMSLNNTGTTISIINNMGVTEDSISYISDLGGNGNGSSLGRKDAITLISNDPTPGFDNISNNSNSIVNNISDDAIDNVSSGGLPLEKTIIATENTTVKQVPIAIKIISPTKSFAGVPVVFFAQPTGTYHENLYKGKFIWSFGDGSIKTDTSSSEFSHTYRHQGEYVVYLEYYQYYYTTKPDAIDRLVIKVAQPMLGIATIYSDGSIDIVNQSNQEIDLINWKIINSTSEYIFTNHIFILPKDKIRFDETLLQLDTNDKDLALIDPSGNKINSIKSEKSKTPSIIKNEVNIETKSVKTIKKQESINIPVNQIASPVNAIESSVPYFSRTTLIFMSLGLLVVVVVGSIMFLWIRKDNPLVADISDFDIDEIN